MKVPTEVCAQVVVRAPPNTVFTLAFEVLLLDNGGYERHGVSNMHVAGKLDTNAGVDTGKEFGRLFTEQNLGIPGEVDHVNRLAFLHQRHRDPCHFVGMDVAKRAHESVPRVVG